MSTEKRSILSRVFKRSSSKAGKDEEAAPPSLPEEERQMIRSILKLEDTPAREIMVPRLDIVAVDTHTPLSQVIDLVIQRGFSRIPLYEENIDNIIGIIYAKDLLRFLNHNGDAIDLKKVAREAHFIPESKKISELLHEFQEKRVHLAIVVDEYGGVSGLVSLEDLLEEIVGDIQDEFDRGEPQIQKVSDTEAIMDAKVSIDQFSEMFSVQIEGDGFDTVGGFVLNQLGKIPSMGDELETQGIKISVLSTIGRRIKKVRV
ncbi:MAG: hemolysin family protein, partial [Dehalococcoidia bacterium]